jgi:hypothetical protein
LKSVMKVKGITFGLPWMKLSVQHKAFEAKICLGVLLQLPLLSLTRPMLGLGNVQQIQQLRVFVKKMKVIIKMMFVLQLIHLYKLKLWMRRDLNPVDELLLLMVMHFNCMKICCCRAELVSLYSVFTVFCLKDNSFHHCLLNNA